MRYSTAAAFRTALEERLLTTARQRGVPLVRLRKLVAFERLLARLMAVAPDRWILKGALAFHFRLAARFRTTKDRDGCKGRGNPVWAVSLGKRRVQPLGTA